MVWPHMLDALSPKLFQDSFYSYDFYWNKIKLADIRDALWVPGLDKEKNAWIN